MLMYPDRVGNKPYYDSGFVSIKHHVPSMVSTNRNTQQINGERGNWVKDDVEPDNEVEDENLVEMEPQTASNKPRS